MRRQCLGLMLLIAGSGVTMAEAARYTYHNDGPFLIEDQPRYEECVADHEEAFGDSYSCELDRSVVETGMNFWLEVDDSMLGLLQGGGISIDFSTSVGGMYSYRILDPQTGLYGPKVRGDLWDPQPGDLLVDIGTSMWAVDESAGLRFAADGSIESWWFNGYSEDGGHSSSGADTSFSGDSILMGFDGYTSAEYIARERGVWALDGVTFPVPAVPLPAAGLLLAGALGLVGGLRTIRSRRT